MKSFQDKLNKALNSIDENAGVAELDTVINKMRGIYNTIAGKDEKKKKEREEKEKKEKEKKEKNMWGIS